MVQRLWTPPSHKADRKKLVELSHRTQDRNPGIKVGTGTEFDLLLRVFHRMRQRHKAGDPKIAGDVEHPKAASVSASCTRRSRM